LSVKYSSEPSAAGAGIHRVFPQATLEPCRHLLIMPEHELEMNAASISTGVHELRETHRLIELLKPSVLLEFEPCRALTGADRSSRRRSVSALSNTSRSNLQSVVCHAMSLRCLYRRCQHRTGRYVAASGSGSRAWLHRYRRIVGSQRESDNQARASACRVPTVRACSSRSGSTCCSCETVASPSQQEEQHRREYETEHCLRYQTPHQAGMSRPTRGRQVRRAKQWLRGGSRQHQRRL
jgi:hypothetical protein